MAKKSFSYDESMTEVQNILLKITDQQIGIDELEAQVKRAKELLSLCQAKLRQTEDGLNSLLEE